MSAPVETEIGKYRLLRKIATGGMAEVYLAQAAGPAGFQKTLVLKRILPHLAEDQAFVEMFLNEARLAALLNHPNIVQIFDLGEADGSYFIAMEYIDGPNLRALCRRAADAGRVVPPESAAKIIALACEGLGYAHDFADNGQALNLIHRDISPDNILLSRTGAVKVVDFGIAKAANQGHLTKTGTLKGKLAYMPPEQLRGKPLDRRADIFSLGVVLYELLSGMKPFDATSEIAAMQAILHDPPTPLDERRPDCPAELVLIVERALEKDRDNRYPDCRAMQRDLDQFLMSRRKTVGAYELAQMVTEIVPATPIPIQHTPLPRSGLHDAPHTPTPAPRTPAPARTPAPVRTPTRDPASAETIRAGRAPTLSLAQTQPMPLHPPVPLRPPTPPPPPVESELAEPTDFTQTQPGGRPAGLLWGGIGLAGVAAAAGLYFLVIAPAKPDATIDPTPVVKPVMPPDVKPPDVKPPDPKPADPKPPDNPKPDPTPNVKPPDPPKPEPVKPEPVKPEPVKPEPVKPEPVKPGKRQPQPRHPDNKIHVVKEPEPKQPEPKPPDPKPADSKPPEPVKPPVVVAKLDTGTLSVDADPPCSVSVDGRPVGSTPVEVPNLPVGSHTVTVSNRDKGLTRQFSVNLSPGERRPEKVKFVPGSIAFRVMPWAFVELDGKPMGQTPIPDAQVYEGEHRVRLSNPELKKEKVVQVQVKPGGREVVKHNFDAE